MTEINLERSAQAAMVKQQPSRAKKPWVAISIFLVPVMGFYLIFTIYPLLTTVYNTFFHSSAQGGQLLTTFVGFGNYQRLFTDPIFLDNAVPNTLIWGVIGTAFEMVTSVALALVIYFKTPLRAFFRVAWFTPVLVSGVIVGVVFRWVFNSDWGLLNTVLHAVHLDGLAVDWLGRTDTPLFVVIFVHWWATFGYSFVIILSGLSVIPEQLLEAAYIDGCSRIRSIFSILLPLLRPTLLTVLILSFIGKMRAFDVVWVLTNGGPAHHSETVATYMQKRAFDPVLSGLDLGYPSTIAVVWFGVVVMCILIFNRWVRPRLDY